MRISSFIPLLMLAACGSNGASETDTPVAPGASMIACAVESAREFSDVCSVERAAQSQGLTLTIRHPGGGFRRLLVTTDGRGVIAADGAEAARVALLSDGLIEVSLGSDKYRLPATVKGAPKARP